MIVDLIYYKPGLQIVQMIAGSDLKDFYEPKILSLIVMSSKQNMPHVFIGS